MIENLMKIALHFYSVNYLLYFNSQILGQVGPRLDRSGINDFLKLKLGKTFNYIIYFHICYELTLLEKKLFYFRALILF